MIHLVCNKQIEHEMYFAGKSVRTDACRLPNTTLAKYRTIEIIIYTCILIYNNIFLIVC